MSERPKLYFDQEFLKVLVATQQAAEMLGVPCISDILTFGTLMYKQDSLLREFIDNEYPRKVWTQRIKAISIERIKEEEDIT